MRIEADDCVPAKALAVAMLMLLVGCGGGGDSGSGTVGDTGADLSASDLAAGDAAHADSDLEDGAADGDSAQDVPPTPQSRLLSLTGCTGFYGAPNESTGTAEGLCGGECICENGVFAPEYDAAFLAELKQWKLLNPPEELAEDPYQVPEKYPRLDDHFCGVVVVDRAAKSYRLETFPTMEALEEAGAIVTHTTACGVCSSLNSLAFLIEMPDQTGPIRNCGMMGLTGDIDKVIQCLVDLGFELPCAQINAYNTTNTRDKCGSVCMKLLNDPYQAENGDLNECIQCDEDMSGDIFRAVAGRARRNSGVPAALCRPCQSMTHIIHAY